MRQSAKRMAFCAVMAALCVVLMLLGAVLELGMYAAPLFAGLCLVPVGNRFGRKYQWLTYAATSVLCLLLIPNPEEVLFFIGLFGWYPLIRPELETLPKWLAATVKFVGFNFLIVAMESLVLAVLAPEVLEPGYAWFLLALGNLTFFLYDRLIPKLSRILNGVFPKIA